MKKIIPYMLLGIAAIVAAGLIVEFTTAVWVGLDAVIIAVCLLSGIYLLRSR